MLDGVFCRLYFRIVWIHKSNEMINFKNVKAEEEIVLQLPRLKSDANSCFAFCSPIVAIKLGVETDMDEMVGSMNNVEKQHLETCWIPFCARRLLNHRSLYSALRCVVESSWDVMGIQLFRSPWQRHWLFTRFDSILHCKLDFWPVRFQVAITLRHHWLVVTNDPYCRRPKGSCLCLPEHDLFNGVLLIEEYAGCIIRRNEFNVGTFRKNDLQSAQILFVGTWQNHSHVFHARKD